MLESPETLEFVVSEACKVRGRVRVRIRVRGMVFIRKKSFLGFNFITF